MKYAAIEYFLEGSYGSFSTLIMDQREYYIAAYLNLKETTWKLKNAAVDYFWGRFYNTSLKKKYSNAVYLNFNGSTWKFKHAALE